MYKVKVPPIGLVGQAATLPGPVFFTKTHLATRLAPKDWNDKAPWELFPRMIRLIHLSDVHITVPRLGWRLRDWFSKRLTGWMNFRLLGRGFRFRQAEQVLAVLMEDIRRRQPDRVVFSGDATALGFEGEVARAADLMSVADPNVPPGLAVPGNHDYYTRADQASGRFERHFAPWQQGERVDGAVYPFAQQVGPYWLVGVNSAAGNFWSWDASGKVGRDQLQRLETLLGRLPPGGRILVTHYPLYLASGKHERRSHGLRDRQEVVNVAARGGVCLWLHGHRHHAYHLDRKELAPFPIICAGSATQNHVWSYGEYSLEGCELRAVRRAYDPLLQAFEDVETFSLQLPAPAGETEQEAPSLASELTESRSPANRG